MADAYQPAMLVGAKGFKSYRPAIVPNVKALVTAAPSFATVASWPDPFVNSYEALKLPGGSRSTLPSVAALQYQGFMTTPQGMGVYSRQPISDPAKMTGWDPIKKSIRSFSTDLSIIDPLGSIENVTGEFFGLQPALIGAGGTNGDPLNWFGERNVGFENYPTRLLDYGMSTLPMIAMHLMGMQHNVPTPKNADGQGFFPFENQPAYWYSLENWKGTGRPPTDDELLNEAKDEAGKVSQSPSLLVPALYERYKWGRDIVVNGMSSGNERIDYLAKKHLEAVANMADAGATRIASLFVDKSGRAVGPIGFAAGDDLVGTVGALLAQLGGATSQVARSIVTVTPGIGTQFAETLMPVEDRTEQLWAAIGIDQRRELLAGAGMLTMATDVVLMLPLLSGAGALISALKAGAKGGDFMAWASKAGMVKDLSLVRPGMTAAEEVAAITTGGWTASRAVFNVAKQVTFDLAGMAPRATQGAVGGFGTTLMVMDRLMAVGMASMLVNWGLESMVPGYAEAVGYDIDQSRPFSDSQVAGLINFTGYFASATAGGYTLARAVKGIPRVTNKALGQTGLLGEEELRGFASFFGGGQRVEQYQRYWKRPDGAAPTAAEVEGPVKSTVFNQLGAEIDQMDVSRVVRMYIDDPALAHLPIEQRVELANDALLNGLQDTAARQAALADLLQAGHSTTSFLGDMRLTDAQRVKQNVVARAAREIEDRMASRLGLLYSEAWWQRQFRSLGVAIDPARPVVAFKGWLRKEAERTGWAFDEAGATKELGNDVAAWRQMANLSHARDFSAVNAEVIEAAKISPVDGILAHPEDYFLMRAEHVFQDRADILRAGISSRKTATPLYPDEAELIALVGREIRTTKELDEWWAGLRNKDPNPENVDLDALLEFLEKSYSILPGRHPINVVDPLTMNYPINALARRLGKEGMYAVAYKPKGSIVAYRPTAREMAIRVSQNAPDGYVLEAPVGIRASLDAIADTQSHVTMNIAALRAEGLRSRVELVEASGDELMFHGTSTVWYQFDPAMASESSLVGHGTYLTGSHRLGGSYNSGGSQGMVKEFRIPANARIWDAEAPMDDAFFALIDADIAKGHAGRMWKAADKARVESGDMLDPDAYLAPGGEWAAGLDAMGQMPRESYIDTVVNGGAIVDYTHHFKNGVNDVLFDAGYEGLTHVGGRNIGGLGEHKVYVMFDIDATAQRAQTLGTGAGGGINDAGRDVSLVVNAARAQVIEDRYRLAIRAARGETTVEEIVDHFTAARASQGQSAEAAWRDMWDEVSRVNQPAGSFDRVIGDVTGQPVQAYYTPYDRGDFMRVLDRFYNPANNSSYWTGRQEADRLAAMGDLVSTLDNGLEKGGPLRFPTDVAGQAYDPAGWARYSAGITQRSSQLAKMDPANVATVRVARRAELPPPVDSTPRMTAADAATATEGWSAVGNSSFDEAALFLYKEIPPSALDDLLDNGLRVSTYGDIGIRANNVPRLTFHTNEGFKTADDMMLIRVRSSSKDGWIFDGSGGSGLPRRYLDSDVKTDLLEVFGADGTWHRLGLMDRKPQDPMPSETMDQWINRMWEDTNTGTPMLPRDDSVWTPMTGSMYDEGMRTGWFAPDSVWTPARAYNFTELTSVGRLSAMPEPYWVEMEKALVTLNRPGSRYTSTLVEGPKAAVKRVWTKDANDQLMLVYERNKGTLGEGNFFRTGRAPAEIRANSNHLWVVDDQAKAKHAGWTDDTPQPLDNQWEQPWAGVTEDPSAGATPIYKHVSYVKLRDGTMLKAPFRDYPMNPGDIYLGNRTALGRKYDSIFQGVRSWRMAEHHLAQMSRSFGGRYGFSTAQVELFKDRIEALARAEAWSPVKVGKIRITPYATARLRDDKVNEIAARIFGEGEVKNLVTGKMETLDYARMFADAHMQAYSLNLTSGIISRVKNFDLLAIGPISTTVADWLIPVLRFKASPIFRTSELLESKVFNALRGVNVSAEERAVYAEAGLHPNTNLLAADFGADPMLESMFTATQNRAASQTMAGIYGLEDLPGGAGSTGFVNGYALWRDVDDLLSRKGMSGLKDDIVDPARYKYGLMFDQQIESVRRELPIFIKARDPEAYRILSEVLKVPDDQMARFIAEDRILLGRWQHGTSTFEDMLAHANKYVKTGETGIEAEALRAMYATEDWQVIETLMRVASMSAQAEAFGTHFFGSYRSALERTINHPMLGIYPASWMYKSAKEWAKFLFDNRTFGHGELRLAMFPAVAMNSLIEKVNMTVAMNTGESWEDWLQNGPARNLLFLWNLLLPGDWSSLPLPLARPLRSIARAINAGEWEKLSPWNLAADTLMGPSGRGGIGIIRDINLSVRGIYDLYEYAAMDKPGQADNLAEGLSLSGVEKTPLNWSDLVNYPDPFGQVNPPP